MNRFVKGALQVAEIAGKTAVSAIPVGGALATSIYDTVKNNCLEKRQKKWQEVLENRISKMEVTLDDLGNSEIFTTAIIKATEVAMKTSSEEKLKYLANATANSYEGNIDETRFYLYMGLIERYTARHMYTKPATTFNKDLLAKYNKNIFSVMEEVWASDTERIDLVVFLNGFAIMSFELKCNFAGQSYQDAILQYRTQRNPKTRLFYFKAGCIVNFAMDLQEVYMTTRLANDGTFFLPFNMGSGNGIDAGKGNPVYPDKYSVYYMWEDILKKDTVLDLKF